MSNIELFDQMADRYDTPQRLEIARICARAIQTHITGSMSKTAMDFGCGTGLIGFALAAQFNSILFVDASQNMIDHVRRGIADRHMRNAEALCVDLENADVDIQPVDYIIAVQVLLHIPDVYAMLHKLYALLKPGGHLMIIDFDKNASVASELVHNGFHQDELIALSQKAGFVDTVSETFHRGENMFMGKDASLFILDAAK